MRINGTTIVTPIDNPGQYDPDWRNSIAIGLLESGERLGPAYQRYSIDNWVKRQMAYLKAESLGRPLFYGAMITEGMVALIWATVASWFFYNEPAPGYTEIATANGFHTSAATVVNLVCRDWLGVAGAILALLGVVAAPITSGDTAFRSARLIVAEWLHLDQRPIPKRLLICIPLFTASILMLIWQIENPDGFNTIWQYFGWSNQTISVFTLWTITVYLVREHKCYWITLIPALFMTVVCSTFLFISKQTFGLPEPIAYCLGLSTLIVAAVWFFLWKSKETHRQGQ